MTSEQTSAPTSTQPPAGVTLRYYRDGDDDAILAVIQEAFPRWPAVRVSVPAIEHLRWKLRLAESPERLHKVAEIDGRIVGVAGGWSRRALLRARAVLTGDGGDASVHPAFQGRGVMTALRLFHYQNRRRLALNVVGGATNQAIVNIRRHVPDPRYLFGNRVERFIRPLTARAAINTFRLTSRRSPAKLGRSALALARWTLARRRTPATAAVTLRTVPAFDERIDAFWDEAARQFDFIQVRDFEYLSWRYDRRGGDFTLVLAEDGGRIAGYAVLCTDISRRRASLADILVLPGRANVAGALLQRAVAWARAQRCETLLAWLPERHPYREALEAAGFVRRRTKSVTAYRVTGAVPEEDLAFLQEPGASIHITLGDTDVV